MKVAILGYGTVGKGVVKILQRFNDIEITHIVVKSKEECLDHRFTTNFEEILLNDVDVLLEMIIGDHPTYNYLIAALSKGISVITSNKATVAAHLDEYVKIAKDNDCQFRFEASVGGGIPWIQSLIKAKRIDEITEIEGILNGTTNYMLDHMLKECVEYNDILKRAQDLGYAEADPSADVDGIDVVRKLMISASIAFQSIININELWVEGISTIQLKDIQYLKKNKYVVRLVGYAKKVDLEYYACVEPVAITSKSILGSVDENNNYASLTGETIGKLQWVGQGAGQLPTANAMVQDLLDIGSDIKNDIVFNKELSMNKELDKSSYIICTNMLNREVFKHVTKEIEDEDRTYIQTTAITNLEKEELIHIAKENDPTLFYVRLG